MSAVPQKSLSLFDAVCIIVGIIVGAGIYETSPMVAGCMGSGAAVFAVWLAGGLLVLCGALSYAGLAKAFPEEGGDVVYLSRAYGPRAGFLFGWCQLAVIRPGDIALMAFVFARYASVLYAPFSGVQTLYAAGAVVVLTLVNVLGVRGGRWTQDILTVVKVGGLLFIIGVGLLAPGAQGDAVPGAFAGGGLRLAMILVLFTYGGWNEMAYVAAEIRNPQKNICRALVLGTVSVIAVYLLANGAFMHALGFYGAAASEAAAVDTVAVLLPGAAPRLIAVVICISALGAVSGLIFTGSRISYALGCGYPFFRGLGKWHAGFGTPAAALVLQGVLSLAIILLAGSFVDTILYSAPAVWLFFLLTGLSVFRMRLKSTVLYPVVPVVFCAAGAFMLFCSVTYAFAERPAGLLILLSVLAVGGWIGFRKVPPVRAGDIGGGK